MTPIRCAMFRVEEEPTRSSWGEGGEVDESAKRSSLADIIDTGIILEFLPEAKRPEYLADKYSLSLVDAAYVLDTFGIGSACFYAREWEMRQKDDYLRGIDEQDGKRTFRDYLKPFLDALPAYKMMCEKMGWK